MSGRLGFGMGGIQADFTRRWVIMEWTAILGLIP
jgi:hypothetical protein